jgi:hypothetical protein
MEKRIAGQTEIDTFRLEGTATSNPEIVPVALGLFISTHLHSEEHHSITL